MARVQAEPGQLIAGLLITIISSGRRIATTGRYRPYPIAGAALAAVGAFLPGCLGAGSWHPSG